MRVSYLTLQQVIGIFFRSIYQLLFSTFFFFFVCFLYPRRRAERIDNRLRVRRARVLRKNPVARSTPRRTMGALVARALH